MNEVTFYNQLYLFSVYFVEEKENFSGKALDVWAMGITLYCFLYGRVSSFTIYHILNIQNFNDTQEKALKTLLEKVKMLIIRTFLPYLQCFHLFQGQFVIWLTLLQTNLCFYMSAIQVF